MTQAPAQLHPADTPEAWAEWVRTPADRHAVEQGCYFDIAAATRVRTFFDKFLRFPSGDPFTLLEWQWEDVVAPLFGWKRPDGLRRYTRGYLSTPKKNGKTTLLSGLALYLLLADGEASPEVYSAAADRDQAGLIFREAVKVIDASPQVQRVARYRESTKTIIGPGRGIYRALSADARRQEGRNASAILFDELHAQPGRELWDALRYAGAARRQPLMLAITTAGSDTETICGEQYQYAKRVLSGEINDPSFFACIFEADAADDWEAEETWRKANPSLGTTVSVSQFRADATEAKESPAKLNSFLRYRLNRWVQTADAWLNMAEFDACPRDLPDLEGRDCYLGLDLSSTDDLTSSVLLFPLDDDAVAILPFFYVPTDNITRLERKHKVPYRAWHRHDHLRTTPGNVVDYATIREHLKELGQTYNIRQIGMDRGWQGQALETQLIEDGHDVVPVGAGWRSQDLPAKRFEMLVKAGKLNHGGHPVYRWNASNAVVEIDKAGNYALNKKLSRRKIDGIAATLMALFCWMHDHQADAGSYYEENPEPILV